MSRIFMFNGFLSVLTGHEKKKRCDGEFTINKEYIAVDVDEDTCPDGIFKDDRGIPSRCELSLFTEVVNK